MQLVVQLFKDPGILFAIADGLLFLEQSILSFIVVILALAFSLFLKTWGYRRKDRHSNDFFSRIAQKPLLGLELMGYACLFVAFIAMTQQCFINFICAFCFGWANLLWAYQLTPKTQQPLVCWDRAIADTRTMCSLVPFCLAALNEPTLLVCVGLLHAGLSAGGESLWILPLLCVVPYITVRYPKMNRAISDACLTICVFWFTLIAFIHHTWILFLSNALFTVAYLEITYQEHRLFVKRKQKDYKFL